MDWTFCGVVFITYLSYSVHFRSFHKNNTRFNCSFENCNRVFSNIYTDIKHIKKYHFEDVQTNHPVPD